MPVARVGLAAALRPQARSRQADADGARVGGVVHRDATLHEARDDLVVGVAVAVAVAGADDGQGRSHGVDEGRGRGGAAAVMGNNEDVRAQ